MRTSAKEARWMNSKKRMLRDAFHAHMHSANVFNGQGRSRHGQRQTVAGTVNSMAVASESIDSPERVFILTTFSMLNWLTWSPSARLRSVISVPELFQP
nr:hypothetical protein CFP56_10945 [Quercus suber]POF00908.1 hypothetical protein CFP56_20856 [Quercus suber]